jgi:hypothetical protein
MRDATGLVMFGVLLALVLSWMAGPSSPASGGNPVASSSAVSPATGPPRGAARPGAPASQDPVPVPTRRSASDMPRAVPVHAAPSASAGTGRPAAASSAWLPDGVPGELFAEATDVEERLVAFDAQDALTVPQRDSLRAVADAMRDSGVVVLAEMCAPRDLAARERFVAAISTAFTSVGMPAWQLREQPAGCSLPGAVVLRPA